MNLSLQVLLYLDYDEHSGFGHVSRSRAFIEAIASHECDLFLCSRLNPLENEPQVDFLDQVKWISDDTIDFFHFDLVYVDTYDAEILQRVEKISIKFKVLLIDENYTQNLPTWPDLVLDVERSTPRHHKFVGKYLHGDILVHSKLQSLMQKRRELNKRKITRSRLIAVVNFGGSVKIDCHLKNLENTFSGNKDIIYFVYCPSALFEDLLTYYQHLENVKILAFSPSYLRNLEKCDFLITNSGTSFVEGLFVGIPLVVFSLFSNAQMNFEKFRFNKSVLYSGSEFEIESEWQVSVCQQLQAMKNSSNLESDWVSEIRTLTVEDIKLALNDRRF